MRTTMFTVAAVMVSAFTSALSISEDVHAKPIKKNFKDTRGVNVFGFCLEKISAANETCEDMKEYVSDIWKSV